MSLDYHHDTEPQPPHGIAVEQDLLGALLINNEAWWGVADVVTADHFYDPLHARIFDAIADGIGKGRAVTPVTLGPAFAGEDNIGDVSVPVYLARLMGSATTVLNAPHYAETVREMWTRRQMMAIGEHLVQEARNFDVSPSQTGAIVAEGLENIVAGHASEKTLAMIDEVVQSALQMDAVKPMTWGLEDLDRHTGGMRRGEYYIVAGRPSMGKSVFATGIALAQAKAGLGVHFYSLEMNWQTVGARVLSDQHWKSRTESVPFNAIMNSRVPDDDWDPLMKTAEDFHGLLLGVDQGASLTVQDIRARSRRLKRNWEKKDRTLDVIIIDYMGLMRPGSRYAGNKAAETEEISLGLKDLAKELDVAVVALVQLNREVEARNDKRPMLSDLRWSGALEQDADIVFMLFREAYYLEKERHHDKDKDMARNERFNKMAHVLEIIIAKQRNGPCKSVEAYVDLASSVMRSKAQEDEAA